MQTRLLPVVGVLVFVSAAIHLALGISGLVEAVSSGGSVLPPALYLLGGLAAITLLGVVVLTPATTTAYAAGAGLMGLFLLAYADVHAFGVAESTLGIDLHDHGDPGHAGEGHGHDHDTGHGHGDGSHSHDHAENGHSHDHGEAGHDHDDGDHDGTLGVLVDHLRGDAYALVSKVAEAGAAIGFAVLAALDR